MAAFLHVSVETVEEEGEEEGQATENSSQSSIEEEEEWILYCIEKLLVFILNTTPT
jgi:hypothetical protein